LKYDNADGKIAMSNATVTIPLLLLDSSDVVMCVCVYQTQFQASQLRDKLESLKSCVQIARKQRMSRLAAPARTVTHPRVS